MSNLNPEFKSKWLAALRSGEYQQCRHKLARTNVGGTGTSYCCIGVAAKVAGYVVRPGYDRIGRTNAEFDSVSGYEAMNDFGLTVGDRATLISMNDEKMNLFAEIADHIERTL